MIYPGSSQDSGYPAAPPKTEDEQLQALLGLSGLTDKADLVKDEMAKAMALRNPSGQDYHTGLGAGLGGLGDMLRNLAGGLKERQAHSQLEDINGQLAQGRRSYGNSLLSLFRGMQPKPPVGTNSVLAPQAQGPSVDDAVRAGLPGAFPFGAF